MSSQLVCRPEQDLPIGILRVSGVLDRLTGGALRHAVARCMSAQPEALLIDVAALDITVPSALTPLGTMIDTTAQWPATPIVLYGARPSTARMIAEWPGAASVTTAADRAEALAGTKPHPTPHRVRRRLRPVPDACREVRHLVTQTCQAWNLDDLASTVALVATELVANVVRHARTTMEFTLGLREGRICLAVRDGSRLLPRPKDPALNEAGGRGLHLIRELTDGWGVLPIPDGKVVWTHLSA